MKCTVTELGGLGATYAVHLRLIGKLVGNFLLVIIELFSLGAFVLSQYTRLTDRRTYRILKARCDLTKLYAHKNYRRYYWQQYQYRDINNPANRSHCRVQCGMPVAYQDCLHIYVQWTCRLDRLIIRHLIPRARQCDGRGSERVKFPSRFSTGFFLERQTWELQHVRE